VRVEGEGLRGVRRGAPIQIQVNGTPLTAFQGEAIATALLARGQVALRATPKQGRPRGLFCAMGVCFDCLVTVDGVPNVRSCVTAAREGMRAELPGVTLEVRDDG
jgi:D-hydroxyproline dehydrogenase subunit gamma